MNNILSFNEYNGQELEVIAYENTLNEGLRNFFNKIAARKVRSELSDEIEMSKSIMDGIRSGLESLNENFDAIRKGIEDDKDEKIKGEKQKALDAIIKILEDSRKSTWDLNQLIDEGEIDYTGFTANVGIASVAYFGILFTPFRATIMIHKGYNYFFNIIKNTIRKALVMLQLNFDQFENLIITKGFQSLDYVQDVAASQKLDDTIDAILKELCGEKTGMIKSKSKAADYRKNIDIAYKRVRMENEKNKKLKQSSDVYNNLDSYNNTYTKSLEALRTYSQDDVQKHLDAIKTSMSKLAGQEVDLQTYSELIIAAAEEHAYKVSTSIYNKFAKMTEVFSLPNQKKLIDLIQAAAKEEMDAAEKRSKELDDAKLKEIAEKNEKDGLDVFKSLKDVEIGDIDENTNKYDEFKIKGAEKWTYDEFINLDKDKDKQDILESWLGSHPEVLKKCDETLQVYIDTPYNNSAYVDSLIDYIAPCISNDKSVKGSESYIPEPEETEESVILSFDEYIFESKKKKKKEPLSLTESPKYKLSDKEKEKLDKKIETVKAKLTDLMTLALGKDYLDKEEFTNEDKAKLDYIIEKSKEKEVDEGVIDELESYRKGIETRYELFIDFKNIDNAQINDLKKLYDNEDVAVAALNAIGKKVLKDNTFVKNSKYIVGRIKKCIDKKKVGISVMSSILLAKSIKRLGELRNNDYIQVENDIKKSEE